MGASHKKDSISLIGSGDVIWYSKGILYRYMMKTLKFDTKEEQ